jgi:uncharacterized protein YbjT (DUF2867 family)
VGTPCAHAALSRGISVRGMGRNKDKVDQALFQRLESFVQCTSIYDIPALDRAVKGVDAVVCANTYAPEVVLEGQLLLLRAAERAGVKIFHAASWNYDWTSSPLGQHEAYDPYIAFENPRGSPWNRESKTLNHMGDGSKAFIYCTADDLAAYTIAAISAPGAEKGGIIRVDSFRLTPEQIVREYEAARGGGVKAQTKQIGSLEDAEKMLAKSRAEIAATEFEKYIALSYVVHMLKGTWDYEASDVEAFRTVKRTSLREWFEIHPDV